MLQWKSNAIASAVILVALTASSALADDVKQAKANPAVVEVAMTNKPDGHQIMILSQNPVPAGPVLFRVKNHSPNSVHEFLVLRTDLDPSAFPMDEDGVKVDESKLSGIKELGDLEPGKSGQMQMTLSAGRYVLFCNQPGHFMAGMFATLNVTQQGY
jgi:uncharacterized cupredoxin-like copper-binding protein